MAVAGEKLSDSLVRDLVRFYESAEKDILNKINAIALKGDSPGTLAHLKTMRENIQQIKKQCQEANQSWVEQAIPRMYSEGLFMADIMLEDLDFMGKAGFGGIHTEAATVLMENTYNRLEDVVNTIGRQTDDIYRALALDHIKGTVLGYDTWTESAKSLQMDLDQRGVTGFIDRMGRKWNMSSYVQMVARTTTMEAHLQGTSNRLLEQGFDLVKVSSHSGACELCLPWEGQILSISGQSAEYPSLDEAKRQGLFHPNCRHAYGLHIDLDSDLFTELGIEPPEEEEKADNKLVAKTIKEAEEISETISAMFSSDGIANARYNYSGLDLEVVNEINSSLYKLAESFPDLVSYVSIMVDDAMRDNVYASAKGISLIKLNPRFFGDLRLMKYSWSDGLAGGYHPKDTDYPSIIAHEMGHLIDKYLTIEGFGSSGGSDGKKSRFSFSVREEVLSELNLSLGDVGKHLSKYAMVNNSEFFAEAFAEAFCSPNPREIATKVMEKVKETWYILYNE